MDEKRIERISIARTLSHNLMARCRDFREATNPWKPLFLSEKFTQHRHHLIRLFFR